MTTTARLPDRAARSAGTRPRSCGRRLLRGLRHGPRPGRRCAGPAAPGAWAPSRAGLGDDVCTPDQRALRRLSIAFDKEFSMQCLEATEKSGYARDLCSYMRNYWGSVILERVRLRRARSRSPTSSGRTTSAAATPSGTRWSATWSRRYPHFCVDVAVGPVPRAQRTTRSTTSSTRCTTASSGWRRSPAAPTTTSCSSRRCENECRATAAWAEICALEQGDAGAAGREDACTRSTCSAP